MIRRETDAAVLSIPRSLRLRPQEVGVGSVAARVGLEAFMIAYPWRSVGKVARLDHLELGPLIEE